jgi:hypothetical protein
MDNIIDAIMGIDKRKEILTLWYEVTYLRMVISQIIPSDVASMINFEKIKSDAQEVVRKRFPEAELNFTDEEVKNETPDS